MGERKGDIRIYIISALFFLCILGGGVFLCLYIFLPETETTEWYLTAGMILSGIPWVFWLVTYFYTCFKTFHQQIHERKHFSKSRSKLAAPSSRSKLTATETMSGAATTTTTTTKEDADTSAAVESPGGRRQVRFGAVIVMGSEDGGKQNAPISLEIQPEVRHEAGGESHCTIGSSSSSTSSNDADHLVSSSESDTPILTLANSS